jgi:hypothetical protein
VFQIPIEEYWYLDTGWGCGLVITKGLVITDTAPIFKRFKRGRVLKI